MHRSNQNFNIPTPHPGKPWAFDHFLCPGSEEFDFPPPLPGTDAYAHSFKKLLQQAYDKVVAVAVWGAQLRL